MKKILILAVFLVSLMPSRAQNEVINMALAVPRQQMTANADVLRVLKSKLSAALAAGGCAQTDYGGIVISPMTTVSGKQMIEGGMRTISVYDVNLTVSVSNIISGTGFNTMSMDVRGEGYSEREALMSAINKMSNNDARLVKFFLETRRKIVDYYTGNRKSIMTQAKTLANMQQYDEALALLSSYPMNISGYDEVANAMTDIYDMYMRDVCSQLLQQANGAFAAGNYEEAIASLNMIDMQSPCAGDVRTLTEKIKREVDAEKRQAIELYLQEMRTAADIQKRRVKAIENIAVAYYQNQPDFYFVF